MSDIGLYILGNHLAKWLPTIKKILKRFLDVFICFYMFL
jgi:hypothetical protein